MRGKASTTLVVTGALAVVLALATLAWACTPSSALDPIAPSSAPAAAPVQVSGHEFTSGVPVQIRWDGENGPVVATATGPDFSVPVTVPADARAGVYYVVALQRDDAGKVLSRRTQSFEVATSSSGAGVLSPSSARTVSSDLWSDLEQGAKPLGAGSVLPGAQPQSAGAIAGLALVGLGFALMSVIAVGAVRRRRAATLS